MMKQGSVVYYCVLQCAIIALSATWLFGQETSGSRVWIKSSNPLYAVADETGSVFLRWRIKKWKKGLVGFELRRRHLDVRGKWTGWVRVGGYPIEPNLTEKHLKGLGLTRVLGRMAEWDKHKNPRQPAEIIKKMQSSAKEFKQARMMMGMREWAIAFGVARIDMDTPRGMLCEYSVAPVIRDASLRLVSQKVMAAVQVRASFGAFAGPVLHEAKARRTVRKGRVKVSFKIRKADIEAYSGSASFLGLLKASPGEPMRGKVVSRIPLRLMKLSADGVYGEYSLSDSSAGRGIIKYAIVPMAGKAVGQPSKRIILGRVKDIVQKPTDIAARITKKGIVVSWKHKGQEDAIEGFRVERRVSGRRSESKKWDLKTKLLPRGVRSWTDQIDLTKLPGMEIQYFVTAVSGDYRLNALDSTLRGVKIPYPKPTTPENFKAKLVMKNGTPTIVCEWDAVKSKRISSYRVQKYLPLEGIWYSFKSSATNTCKNDVGRGGGSLTLRVKSVATDGQESEPSQQVTVKWPPVKMIPVDQISFWAEKRPDGSLKLLWRGSAWSHIKGYRILQDGKTITTEKELGRYVRQFMIWTPKKDGGRYELYVVDIWGRVSKAVLIKN